MDKKALLTIENDYLRVTVTLQGGNLTSVFDKASQEELLWQGDSKSWTGQDLVIFPFIARLKDGYYTVNGKKFSMDIHGLACYADFVVKQAEKEQITLFLNSTSETLQKYPFAFELSISYKIIDNKLKIIYSLLNKNEATMPFMLGGHPAFIVDAVENDAFCDTSGNYLIFDKEQELQQVEMDENNFFVEGYKNSLFGSKIELSKYIFQDDAVIFKGVKGGVTLTRKNGRKIHFELNNPPILAVWSHEKFGSYVCIEPWFGLPDSNPPIRELQNKLLINHLAALGTFQYEYKITLL